MVYDPTLPHPLATKFMEMIQEGQTLKNSFFNGSDDVKLADMHHFNTGIFKILDFVVYRVMKVAVKIVHFVTLFALAFVQDTFMFIDKDLGTGLGLFIYDVVGQVLNLVFSIVSMIFARADVRNVIPRSNYFDGAFRMADESNIEFKDELVAQWFPEQH